jgi:phosphate transport system substrate-binding protein
MEAGMRLRTLKAVVNALVLMLLAGSGSAHGEEVNGSGSTFVFPILSKWADDYGAQGGDKITYQPIGSSGGVMQIKSGMVDFGASDMPLQSGDLDQSRLAQFPVVIGGVVAVVNISGIKAGQLHFTGPVLAGVFLGKITNWSAPEIKALNPGIALPDAKITVVHRSDGSGTTFNWVNYLSKVSPEWKARVGEGPSVSWPIGIPVKGNEGVANLVNRTKNSIGYVEYAYVFQNKMAYAAIQNRAGKFVEPGAAAFQAAAAGAEWKGARDFFLVMTDAPGDDAYPIAATTFVLMGKSPPSASASRSKAALKFFQWALSNGQKDARSLAYVPLPDPLVQQVEAYWQHEMK